MNSDDVKLSAVNWEHGMLLTPEHFLRQERYFDSALLWLLRYGTIAYGLVGGGPRLPESERGAVRHDPVVVLDEDEAALNISVTQCRGLTPAGCIVDIDPEHPVRWRFMKADLEGVAESGVYLACLPHTKEVVDGPLDEFNPQMRTERRPSYTIALQVKPEDAPYAIAVARIRRPKYGSGYEKDPEYIPACTSMASYSELAAAWRRLVEDVTVLADRYTDLYRAMQEFLVLFKERGIDTDLDIETLGFVGRMVVALQNCVYDLLDPVQSPQSFFGQLHRFLHNAAAYLDLSPPVQQYFESLKETGETEFIPLVEQQKKILLSSRTWNVHQDLAVEVRSAMQSLGSLKRLEQALEGKYIDFRLSPSLEAMNFVFDRGGRVLYKLAAKPARVQGFADELTFTFSQLRLEGRDRYRLILTSEPSAPFEKGAKITVEIRINEGSGFKRRPVILSNEATFQGQRNFEFDFEAPDVPTITDIRVSLQAHHPIRSALLFVRHRFYAARQEEPAGRPLRLESVPPEAVPAPPPAVRVDPRRLSPEPSPRRSEPPRAVPPPLHPAEPARGVERPAPWDPPKREDRPGDAGGPPPRRRRLE